MLAPSVSFEKKTRRWPIQLQLVARFQVLNYVRLNCFGFFLLLLYGMRQTSFHTERRITVFAFGGIFALPCFLVSVKCKKV